MVNLEDILKDIGIEGAKLVEETIDPQFLALERLKEKFKPTVFFKLVVGNALVSYQLSGTGEAYWEEFADFFARFEFEDPVEALKTFLFNSKYNLRIRNMKMLRLERYNDLKEDFSQLDCLELWELLGKVFGKEKKTVCFAVKMFGYAKRALGLPFDHYPFAVPIPLDSRIIKITKKITNEKPLDFWFRISNASAVPSLHLDSLLWLAQNKSLRERIASFGPAFRDFVNFVDRVS